MEASSYCPSKAAFRCVLALLLLLCFSNVIPAEGWRPDERLTNDPDNSRGSSVASDPDGNVHVVWGDERDGNSEIYYKRWDGVAWTSDQRLTNDPAESWQPSVASDPYGNVHVVWGDERDGNSEIYYKRWDGVAWTSDQRLTNDPAESWQPSVASDPDGNVHVVWGDNRDGWEVYYKRWNGLAWTDDERLSGGPGGGSGTPSIASDPYGNVHVVWQDLRDGNWEIYYKRWDGVAWTSDQRLTNDPEGSYWPSIASDPDGNVHLVWYDLRDGNWEIYYKRWNGLTWTEDERLTNDPGDSGVPSIASDPDGNVHVVWWDERDGNREVYYKRWDGVAWTNDERLTDDPAASTSPSVESDPHGRVLVVWDDSRDGNFEIYYKTSRGLLAVPAAYGTIQHAISAAAPGDIVLVAPGTYRGAGNRDLDFGGKDLWLISEAGPAATIIDCDVQGQGFYFHGGESEEAVVDGFTIRYSDVGGAVECTGLAFPTIRNCIFEENRAIRGAALFYSEGGGLVSDCIFVGNRAQQAGGALQVGPYANLTVRGCTFYENRAPVGSGVSVDNLQTTLRLENVIIAFGVEGEAVSCVTPPSLSCCDIYGNEGGDWVGCLDGQLGVNGNISAGLFFCDPGNGDFTLAEFSPCAPDNSPAGCGLIGALPVGCPTAVSVALDALSPLLFRLAHNYPNPFNPTTTIDFELPEAGRVSLRVYDIDGRLVRTLVDGDRVSGFHSVVWDGRNGSGVSLGSGVYVYRLEVGDRALSKTLVLAK